MVDKLSIYNAVKEVPEKAKKPIKGGRLNGYTDINPMWRIKTLTEQFGVCGYGWYYEILEQRLEQGAKDEIAAFVTINLYVKIGDEWSKPIQGIGGNKFIALEKNGLYTSDECFKMALTDALSVACKALGIGADVYWNEEKTKYDEQNQTKKPNSQSSTNKGLTEAQIKRFYAIAKKSGYEGEEIKARVEKNYKKKLSDFSKKEYDEVINIIEMHPKKESVDK